jgi:cytochrome c
MTMRKTKVGAGPGVALAAIVASGLFVLAANPARAADADKGKKIFEVCTGCHSEGPHAVGPSLRGVYGRQSGSLPDYKYSPAMKRSKLEWNDKNLAEYIANPSVKVKANNMSFRGVRDPKDIDDLVAFLKDYK